MISDADKHLKKGSMADPYSADNCFAPMAPKSGNGAAGE
jgi:hypothetical protein